MSLLATGDGASGIPLLAAAASDRDAAPAQIYLLGLLNQECFNLDLKGLERARTVLSDDPTLLECLGRRYEGKGRYADAEAAFRHWADAHPDLAEPYARLGELYVTAGWRKEALTAFARYRQMNPGSEYALRRMAAVTADEVGELRPHAAVFADPNPVPPSRRGAAGPKAESEFNKANRYQHGLGVPADPTQAAEAYARAAQDGHPVAQLRLALLLQEGRGVERNPEEAVRWLTRSAEDGLPDAQLYLALACLTGDGRPRDLADAARWSGRAANQGIPEAQFLLGTLYRYGIGIGRDTDAANEWLMKAATTFLEAGRWRAGRRAVIASIEVEGGGPEPVAAPLAAAGNGRTGDRGTTP